MISGFMRNRLLVKNCYLAIFLLFIFVTFSKVVNNLNLVINSGFMGLLYQYLKFNLSNILPCANDCKLLNVLIKKSVFVHFY